MENLIVLVFSIFTSNKNITNKNIYWIRIYNGGEISKENPVYYMLCGDYDDDNMYGDIDMTENSAEHPSDYVAYKDFDEFIDLLNKNLIL